MFLELSAASDKPSGPALERSRVAVVDYLRPISGRGSGWAAMRVQIGHSDLIHEIGRHGPFDFERMRPMEARQA